MTPLRLGGDVRDDDDTPSNGHGPPGQRPASVPGGEIGARLHAMDVRLTDLDARDTAQHGEVVARLDALTRTTEEVGGRLVAGLAALEEAHRQTVTLRAIEVVRLGVERCLTPASAPILAACVLVVVVALAGSSIRWGDMQVGAVAAMRANVDSDEDMPASVGGAGASQPEP